MFETRPSHSRYWQYLLLHITMCLCVFSTIAVAQSNSFCGSAVQPTGNPTDLMNVEGDQSLQYVTEHQPANINSCSKGAILAKCGDFISAHRVFDKCIKANYAGAMIWKANMIDEGMGIEPDPAAATALLHRAATSGDPGYESIAKMLYAKRLNEGNGIEKNQEEARKWFESAAAAGNKEAREILKTQFNQVVPEGHGTPPTIGETTVVPASVLMQYGVIPNPSSTTASAEKKSPDLAKSSAPKSAEPTTKVPKISQTQTKDSTLNEAESITGQKLTKQDLSKAKPIAPSSPSPLPIQYLIPLLALITLGWLRKQFESSKVMHPSIQSLS